MIFVYLPIQFLYKCVLVFIVYKNEKIQNNFTCDHYTSHTIPLMSILSWYSRDLRELREESYFLFQHNDHALLWLSPLQNLVISYYIYSNTHIKNKRVRTLSNSQHARPVKLDKGLDGGNASSKMEVNLAITHTREGEKYSIAI